MNRLAVQRWLTRSVLYYIWVFILCACTTNSHFSGIVYYTERGGIEDQGDLYLYDLQKGKELALTDESGFLISWNGYDWSPVAGQIAYVAGVQYHAEIYTMGITGQQKQRLTNNALWERNPRWSPDGSQIAFNCQGPDGTRPYIMNADGSEFRPLLADSSFSGSFVSWSPSGRWVALTDTKFDDSPFANTRPSSVIVVVDPVSGAEAQRIDDGLDHLVIAWSPDSTRLAFTAGRDETGYALYIADVASGNITKPVDVGDVVSVAWSPDGQKLALSACTETDCTMYLTGADGQNLQPLLDRPQVDISGQWSPDGKQILFISGDGQTDHFDLYVIDVSTKDIQRITENEFYDGLGVWVSR